MPDANHEFDIPVLTDVLVPGKPVPARSATQPEAPPPRAGDVPDLPPEVAPELAASGLPPVEASVALSTAYDAPAGAAGADALPVSRLATGADEARRPEARELVAEVPAAPGETEGRGSARESEVLPQARAALPEATFVAPEPVPTPESTIFHQTEPTPQGAAEASPLPEAAPAGLHAPPLEAHEAEPDVPDAPFVAPEPVVPSELAGAPEPLPEPAVDTALSASEAQFAPPEPLAPPELAGASESRVSPEPAAHQDVSALSEPPVVPHEPVPLPVAEPESPISREPAVEMAPDSPEARFAPSGPEAPQEFIEASEPVTPPELAAAQEPAVGPVAEAAPHAPEAYSPELAAAQPFAVEPEAVCPPEVAAKVAPFAENPPFESPEPRVPRELAAAPEPLAASAPPAHTEPSASEAVFVAPEPAVPQEFAASPEPLAPSKPDAASVTSSPAPALHEAVEAPLVRDDEHDAPDDASLAYALTNPEQAAEPVDAEPAVTGSHPGIVDAPISEVSLAGNDVVARTESVLHAIEAMPPAAFAELTPFAAAEPMPARFADHEAPPPVELQHGAPEPLPAAAPSAPAASAIDAQRVVERLHGRVAGYLAGEGRALIDARCREVVQQHAAALAGDVSQQVLLALAPEIERWVSEAIGEALADREPPSA
ncbi:DUF2486 family protein [Burkholderia plantarii]|uniref:DUF2486 family protein n=1 Tax=Burkholderia plantarii TaxID=41899 RepID=UPI0018DE842C|nr:DUF2486 family protein [Burkholderia plantarii]MBI0327574.1 DUF2486 family protein [Burkholderia plantarii]